MGYSKTVHTLTALLIVVGMSVLPTNAHAGDPMDELEEEVPTPIHTKPETVPNDTQQQRAVPHPEASEKNKDKNKDKDEDQDEDDNEEPSSGMGLLITGSILTVVGALNMASSAACRSDDLIEDATAQDVCFGAALTFGGIITAVGVPLLITGILKRKHYNDWRERHGVAQVLSEMRLVVSNRGAAMRWQRTF